MVWRSFFGGRMKEFECPVADILVTGSGVEPFLAAFGPYRVRGEKVLTRHFGASIEQALTDGVPIGAFLRAMSELQEQFGPPFMRKVGSYVLERCVFPPGIDTIAKCLALTNVAFYMNHTDDGQQRLGTYDWKATGERSGRMRVDVPYPCALDLGILESFARKFEPAAKVEHEPGPCRHHGDSSCTYVVEW
jgi:hypothetical protein